MSPGAQRPAHADLAPLRSVKILDQVRERIRLMHYSLRTEQAYVYWCRAFIRWHGVRHPAEMGGPEVEAFLTYLAAERGLAASSHRQALSALLFLYGKVLGLDLPWMSPMGRPQSHRRLPVVLSPQRSPLFWPSLQMANMRCWLGCSTAQVCASARRCSCGSRISISRIRQ
jgi:hypothetical protein